MAPPYIPSERDSIPLAVPGSRAAGGDGVVVGSEPLTLAVPGSRAADGKGTAHIYMQWLGPPKAPWTIMMARIAHSTSGQEGEGRAKRDEDNNDGDGF